MVASDATFNKYLELVVGFSCVVYIFHTYLDVRQLKYIKLPNAPPALAKLFTEDLYKKTQAYSLDKWWYGFIHGLFNQAQSVALLVLGFLPWFWNLTGDLLAKVGLVSQNELVHTVAFVLLLSLVSLIVDLPWSLYSTFVIEQRHGFNKQTLGLFFTDLIKQLVLGCILMPPIICGVTYILQHSGPWLPLYLWGFIFSISLIMMTIYPVVIAPLFNKYENLPEGSLKEKIEALAGSLKFPLKKLYRVDGSKRSAHSNAYMYGFFNNKRIVLYDTLLEQCSEEQVVAVLAHELGHWKLRHTAVLFIVSQVVMLAQFSLFAWLRASDSLFTSFGFHDAKPAFMSFILFQYVSAPIDEVIHFLSNIVSRMFEFQADGFAVGLGHATELKEALLKLEEQNKGSMNVDPLYSAYHYSHPPLVERLKAIDAGAKKAD